MARLAFLFPGQGAQTVGMGRDFAEAFPSAARVFDEAGQVLGWDVAAACFNGPQAELDRTSISQPAILTVSTAIVAALREAGAEQVKECSEAAGLSLGEYSALVMAGALEFADALRLVQQRGRFMEEACAQNPGAMASVLGLDDEIVEALCAQAREVGMVVAANFNSPGQVVVSGTREAVARVAELARERKAKRVLPLAVSGAFHSPLMEPAAERLAGGAERRADEAVRDAGDRERHRRAGARAGRDPHRAGAAGEEPGALEPVRPAAGRGRLHAVRRGRPGKSPHRPDEAHRAGVQSRERLDRGGAEGGTGRLIAECGLPAVAPERSRMGEGGEQE